MTFRDRVVDLLSRQQFGVVSSLGPGGHPQSAVVGVALTPALELVFDTLRSSRKYRNIAVNPAVSFCAWDGEVTVQIDGVAREIDESEWPAYQAVYFRAFPDGPSRVSWDGLTYIVIQPRWCRLSDFSSDPPRIDEADLADSDNNEQQ
ncbi:MAG: pyridoxamine 5'-phosphate oxidase family protein [Bryobacterales bacterium]|nr:pyridoxamine 5'-phosphate oxidase family protein [Bryobacterales bacterium]